MIFRASKQDFKTWLKLSTLVVAFASTASTQAFAAQWPKKCAPSPYEGDKAAVIKEGNRAFKKFGNDKLLNALFFELTHLEDIAFARSLAEYLQDSETKQDRKTFIEILAHAAKLGSSEPKKLDAKELCDHYALYVKKYE
jgi:hypothetical protein